MRNFFTGLGQLLFYLIFFGTLVTGVYHAFKKHGALDGIVSIAIFPWGLYRGAEFWWHDDYKNVNWDKRLASDLQTSIYFITVNQDKDADKYKNNEDMEKFSNKISKYPEEKKNYLAEGTKLFINYSMSITDDFSNNIEGYKNGNNVNINSSTNTKNLEEKLIKYDLKEEVEIIRSSIEKLNKNLQDNLYVNDRIDEKDLDEIISNISLSLKMQEKEYKRTYKTIFDKELD